MMRPEIYHGCRISNEVTLFAGPVLLVAALGKERRVEAPATCEC